MNRDREYSKAIPYFGYGKIPPERDKHVSEDTGSLIAVVKLFLRSWPYIRPLLLGHWYVPGKGKDPNIADNVGGEGYSFAYAPIVVIGFAIAAPLFGYAPTDLSLASTWCLYVCVLSLCVNVAALPFARGGAQNIVILLTALSGILINVVTTFFIDGYVDGFYSGVLTVLCLAGWMIQFRFQSHRLEARYRISAHLVYYYAIDFIRRFINLAMGLVLVDLLNQTILLAEPMMPWLAELWGRPDLARGTAEVLTVEQRIDIVWLHMQIEFVLWLLLLPFDIFAPWYNVWIMQRINQNLRLALVERWHQLSLNYHSDHRVGDSIFRIYQDSSQVTGVINRIINLVITLGSYATCVVLVSLFSPLVGVIAGGVLIPAFIIGHWAMPRMRVRSLVYRAATSDTTATIQEAVKAIKLIKANRSEEREQDRFENDSVIAMNAAFSVRMMVVVVTILMFELVCVCLLAGEFLIATWASEERPTFWPEIAEAVGISFVIWNLAAFNWVRGQFHEASGDMRSLMREWLSAQDMAMGLQRVFDILDVEPDIKNAPDAIPLRGFTKEINFDQVGYSYQSDRPVLEDISFTAKPSTITAIVGPTGSGKSTIVSLLLRLFDPDKGSISIDGVDIRKLMVGSLRQQISIALQENVLFAMTVRDNIKYAMPDATDAEVETAVRIADMANYVSELPQGLDTVLSDRGGKLSTGQRQRLSIARAVVKNTPILVLDEPTASLDAETDHRVMANLADWGKDRALFVITHRLSTIRRANQILYVDSGSVLECGTHEQLMQIESGQYRGLVEAETQLQSDAKVDLE